MPLPIVTKIGEASKAAWPPVQQAVEVTMRSLAELAEISEEAVPRVEAYVARGASGQVRRRKICEETIWALASIGWLRTGGERDVILAARAVAIGRDDDTIPDDEFMAREDTLITVVNALPEYMTTPQEASA